MNEVADAALRLSSLSVFANLRARFSTQMLAKVNSAALYGIDALRVEVEIDLASGLPQLATVGLPEGAVKESKDRIRAAVKNCGYTFPAKRITINLAPADIKKEGSVFQVVEIKRKLIDGTGDIYPSSAHIKIIYLCPS